MSSIHPSRRPIINPPPVSSSTTHKSKKRKPTNDHHHQQSISHLRRKIRDVTRLLTRSTNPSNPNSNSNSIPKDKGEQSTLPPAARIQAERALASYKRDLQLAQQSHKEKKLADRYRMVRFFERQKSTRALNSLLRSLPSSPKAYTPTQTAQLAQAQLNLNYTLYFPLDQKYISLYRDSSGSKDSKSQAEKEKILQDIKRRMQEGTLGKKTANAKLGVAYVDDEGDYDEDEVVKFMNNEDDQEEGEESGEEVESEKRKKQDRSQSNKKRKTAEKETSKSKGDKTKIKSSSKRSHENNSHAEEQAEQSTDKSGFFEF